jgi:hypothetical protein
LSRLVLKVVSPMRILSLALLLVLLMLWFFDVSTLSLCLVIPKNLLLAPSGCVPIC